MQQGVPKSTAATTPAHSHFLPPVSNHTRTGALTSLLLLSTNVIFFFVTGSMKGDTAC